MQSLFSISLFIPLAKGEDAIRPLGVPRSPQRLQQSAGVKSLRVQITMQGTFSLSSIASTQSQQLSSLIETRCESESESKKERKQKYKTKIKIKPNQLENCQRVQKEEQSGKKNLKKLLFCCNVKKSHHLVLRRVLTQGNALFLLTTKNGSYFWPNFYCTVYFPLPDLSNPWIYFCWCHQLFPSFLVRSDLCVFHLYCYLYVFLCFHVSSHNAK